MNKIDEFYAAFGRFLLAWAELELGLDVMVLRTRLMDKQPTSKVPHQLGAKLKFVRRQAEKLGILEAHRTKINALFDEITSLVEIRHDYVHGAIIERQEGQIGITAVMARLLQPADRDRRPPVKVTTTQINRVANQVQKLCDEVFGLADALGKVQSH